MRKKTAWMGRAGGVAAGAAAALLLALPAGALDSLEIGRDARRGPTAEERADRIQSERRELQLRAEELAVREAKLREVAAAEAAAERTSCPPLVRIKYPWISCVTNAWGGKDLVISGSGSASGVQPLDAKLDATP